MARHLYLAPLPQFLTDVVDEGFPELLSKRLTLMQASAPSSPEIESWRRSLVELGEVLRRPDFNAAQVFVELFMPLNNQRCDVLLTGRNSEGPSAVVVELKQWSFVQHSYLEEHVAIGGQNRLHPSVQVRDYVETLRHFHSAFTGPGERIRVAGAAFLHEMGPRNGLLLRDPRFGGAHLDYPMFFSNERAAFAAWLSDRIVPGPGHPVAQRIEAGRPLPSPKLLDLVVETVKGKHEWRLLNQQKTAYFSIRHAVVMAKETGKKKVLIVRGGPGTGKSVLGMQLLADAARMKWAVAHASGTKAFQTVLQGTTMAFAEQMLKSIHNAKTKKALPVKHLFTTFSEIARAGTQTPDALDLTICDEAHRLWEFRQSKYGTRVKRLSETPMVQEVIAASRVSAFFLDDNQSVRPGEIGRSEFIVEHAEAMGVEVQRFELDEQFRCAGSESYIRWVDGLLGLRAGLDVAWRDLEVYCLRVWDSMPALDAHLRKLRRDRQRCRLVAGFCWRWREPDALRQLPIDVKDARFGDWSAPWIEKGPQDAAPLEHRYYRWATSEADDLVQQVGSIYSVQGFEFDAVGVIWGEDLVWRSGAWVAQLDRNKDNAFKQELRASGEDPVTKLVNIYRVLLTRGMRETHLFILDEETRRHVEACLSHQATQAIAVGAPEMAIQRRPTLRTEGDRATPSRGFSPRPVVPRSDKPWLDGVPVVDLAVAAGEFGEERWSPDDLARVEDWISWDGAPPFKEGMFVARVAGTSMHPLIPSGSFCLFRLTSLGPARAKTLLVRLHGADTGTTRFTVKDVVAEWRTNELGERECAALVLEPRNRAYPTSRIEAEGASLDVDVVAELVEVLGR